MIGLSATTVNGNVTVTTDAGDDLISVVGVTLATPAGVPSGTLTISAGAGENTVLVDDNFGEIIESSLETFVTTHPVFSDGQDNEFDPCVADLANDLSAASGVATTSQKTHNHHRRRRRPHRRSRCGPYQQSDDHRGRRHQRRRRHRFDRSRLLDLVRCRR